MEKRTDIYKRTAYGERHIGYVSADGKLIKFVGAGEIIAGRFDGSQIYRLTAHDERELGFFDEHGTVHSHGLFEGGELGWVEADGVVTRAGLIFGEEEVGRVEGAEINVAAAALLLLFLPDDAEEEKIIQRR